MMGSDIHHRTEDFRKIYRTVLADLKEVMGTANDVLMSGGVGHRRHGGFGYQLFSPGDKVIVCSAGKFGERWVEITKAYGLEHSRAQCRIRRVVTPERVEAALRPNPDVKGVFVQASETSTGAAHDIKRWPRRFKKTDAIFVVDAITGLGTQPLDIDGWGLDIVIGGSQKAFMIPPGLAFMSHQPEGMGVHGNRQAAALLFQPQEGAEERARRRIQLDARRRR